MNWFRRKDPVRHSKVVLTVDNFVIDPVERSGNTWYTHAGFEIGQVKSTLGFKRKIVFTGDGIVFMISSDTLKTLPDDNLIDPRKFNNRLVLEPFSEQDIRNYVEKKFQEASRKDTIEEAFNYLEQFFLIDD